MSRPLRVAALLGPVLAAVCLSLTTGPAAGQPEEDDDARSGRELFVTGCSSCHGIEGRGSDQGPPLIDSGEAAAYYYLSTGRMPLANTGEQPQRKDPAYSAEQIDRLVDYVGSLGAGPPLPDIDPDDGDLALGGELYRANCAPCHSAGGIGGALSYGRAAPTVHEANEPQIASAVRVGPGQMPVFDEDVFSDRELEAIVRYVRYLQSAENPGGARLGTAGPIPEGFVAWIFGMGLLLLAALWIGKRQRTPRS